VQSRGVSIAREPIVTFPASNILSKSGKDFGLKLIWMFICDVVNGVKTLVDLLEASGKSQAFDDIRKACITIDPSGCSEAHARLKPNDKVGTT